MYRRETLPLKSTSPKDRTTPTGKVHEPWPETVLQVTRQHKQDVEAFEEGVNVIADGASLTQQDKNVSRVT